MHLYFGLTMKILYNTDLSIYISPKVLDFGHYDSTWGFQYIILGSILENKVVHIIVARKQNRNRKVQGKMCPWKTAPAIYFL